MLYFFHFLTVIHQVIQYMNDHVVKGFQQGDIADIVLESLEVVFSCILRHQVRRNEDGQYLPATGVKCEIVIDFQNVTANGDICGEEHWSRLRRNGGG